MIEISTSSQRREMKTDFAIDVRDLPNPFTQKFLKGKTGLDLQVRDFVLSFSSVENRIRKLVSSIAESHYLYCKIPTDIFKVHIICVGGKHRSVVVAEEVASRLRNLGYEVKVIHHELETKEKQGDR